MTSGVESDAEVTGTARSSRERQAASDSAVGTGTVAIDNEFKSRIVPTPGNGRLHRARLRFGSHLKSDQRNLIPENPSNTHCVAVFERPRDAESAIREPEGAGFDMRRLSLIGRGARGWPERGARRFKILGKRGNLLGELPRNPRHPARRVSSGRGHGSEDQIEAQETPRAVQA